MRFIILPLALLMTGAMSSPLPGLGGMLRPRLLTTGTDQVRQAVRKGDG